MRPRSNNTGQTGMGDAVSKGTAHRQARAMETAGGSMKLASVFVAVLALAARVAAQPPPHLFGDRISGSMHVDGATRVVTDTATLTFQSQDGGPVYTIDFTARHPMQEAVALTGVVDIVVTQHLAEDESPLMLWQVDGEIVPSVTRLRGRRSVVTTISLDEFDRITRADLVVDRTFGTELELGPGQIRMLRLNADRWLGRVR
jgi:hypothetical protein